MAEIQALDDDRLGQFGSEAGKLGGRESTQDTQANRTNPNWPNAVDRWFDYGCKWFF